MASPLRQLIRIVLDSDDAQDEAQQFNRSLTNAMVKSQLATAALNKALGLMRDGIVGSIEAAAEYERTNQRLAAALRNQGLEVERNLAAFNAQASQLEILTGISDEQIRATQALALNMGVSADRVDEFVRAAVRLSNTTGQDVNGAMRQLVKTTSGLKGELGEAIPAVAGLTAEQLKAGDAARVINEELADNLDLLNQGLAGAWNRTTNALSSVAEALVIDLSKGSALSDVLNATANALETVGSVIQKYGSVDGFLTFLDIAFTGGENISDEELAALNAPAPKPSSEGQRGKPAVKGKGRGRKRKRRGGATLSGIEGALINETGGAEFFTGLTEATGGGADPRIEMEQERARIILDLERRIADGSAEIAESNLDRKIKILNDEVEAERRAAKERAEIHQKFANIAIGLANSVAQFGVDSLLAIAKGEEESLGRRTKAFLEGTGRQLVASGIQHSLSGLASFNPVQAAIGGVEIAAGTAMIGGSLAIPGEVSAGPPSGADAGMGAGGAANDDGDGTTRIQRTFNVTVIGQPTAEAGRFFMDSVREAEIRGIS